MLIKSSSKMIVQDKKKRQKKLTSNILAIRPLSVP
jgi:hypothetical protein